MKTLGLALLTLFVVASSFAQKSATEVFVMDGDNRIQMKYSRADTRGSHSIVTAKIYYTLNGPKSDLRIKSSTPQFFLYSDPAERLTDVLVRLDVKSDRREIRWMKSTYVAAIGTSNTSLPKDHVIDVKIEEVSLNQGIAN